MRTKTCSRSMMPKRCLYKLVSRAPAWPSPVMRQAQVFGRHRKLSIKDQKIFNELLFSHKVCQKCHSTTYAQENPNAQLFVKGRPPPLRPTRRACLPEAPERPDAARSRARAAPPAAPPPRRQTWHMGVTWGQRRPPFTRLVT